MSATLGSLGSRPTVELDGVLFPLVQGSTFVRSPLNPFSPASQAGNSARITDARLAVQVWDDFTGGLGQREEDTQGGTSYAEGNLDTRVPGAVATPPLHTLLATVTALASYPRPLYIEYMRHATNPRLFIYTKAGALAGVYNLATNVFTARLNETVRGFAAFNGAHYYIAYTGADSKVYKTTDAGATWTQPGTFTAKSCRGLAVHDGQLFTFNETDRAFVNSLDGATWATHSTSFYPNPTETLQELFVWMEPAGARDTLFALTTQRILGYELDSTDWHTYYDYEGVFQTAYPNAHKFRRDSNIYFAPCDDPALGASMDKNGLVLMFNPQTVDETGPTKRYGLPDGAVDGVMRLVGGIHWLYAWAAGTTGGVYALNEFQGWTMLFDPAIFGTATVLGGGYSQSKLWTVTSDGRLYQATIPDRRQLPPVNGVSYNTGKHYLRSAWTTHNQKNRWKIGAYFEIDMRDSSGLSGVPVGTAVEFRYRVDGGVWTTITLGGNTGNDLVGLMLMQSVQPSSQTWPAVVVLPANVEQSGIPYKRIQWEIAWTRGGGATQTAVLASVALYYTYWQESHYSYQFNIDLTPESWAAYPDETLNVYSREALVEILLQMVEQRRYHTFRLATGGMEEYLGAVDLLLAGREDSDMGGGVYSVTVRDLAVL